MRHMSITVLALNLTVELPIFLTRSCTFQREQAFVAGVLLDKVFDLIYQCDVLNHIPDPLAELSLMQTKLKEDRFLVLETGNTEEVRNHYFHWYPSFRYPEHWYFFAGKSLNPPLARIGFESFSLQRCSLPYMLLGEKIQYAWRDSLSSSKALPVRMPLVQTGKAKLTPGKAARKFFRKNFHSTVDYLHPYRLGSRLSPTRRDQSQTLIVAAREACHSLAFL